MSHYSVSHFLKRNSNLLHSVVGRGPHRKSLREEEEEAPSSHQEAPARPRERRRKPAIVL